MNCKYCGTELPEGVTYCSNCKRHNVIRWQLIVGIVAAVVLLAALAVVLYFGMDLDFLNNKSAATDPSGTADATVATEATEPAYVPERLYTGTDEEVAAAEEEVVATVNGFELTNRLLQLYYNVEVNNFINTNYSYLSSMGFDYTQPLANQKCYYDEVSWQEYFVEQAINTWRQQQLIMALAKEADFKLSEDTQLTLDSLHDDLKAMATESGYADVSAMLYDYMRANITADDYYEYCNMIAYYSEFVMLEPGAEALEQYYADNEDYFLENNVGKDAEPMNSVRHILIQPTGGTTDESGKTTYTDEEWAACETKAQELLDEWKAGEATEDSFAAMAAEHTADTASAESGGLYSGITSESSYVEPFLDWSIDSSRQVGDTDIVKTEYGYHIMYFSASEVTWEYYAKMWYAQEREMTLVEEGSEKWPVEVLDEVICLKELDLVG